MKKNLLKYLASSKAIKDRILMIPNLLQDLRFLINSRYLNYTKSQSYILLLYFQIIIINLDKSVAVESVHFKRGYKLNLNLINSKF